MRKLDFGFVEAGAELKFKRTTRGLMLEVPPLDTAPDLVAIIDCQSTMTMSPNIESAPSPRQAGAPKE